MPGNVTQMGYNTETGQREWNPLGAVPPPPGSTNPYGIMGDLGAWQRATSGVGYGPGADQVAAQYAHLFGTMTPQARVAAGGAPTDVQGYSWTDTPESQRYANGGGANNQPTQPIATPQQAGQNNSVYPGWSTGQPAVGYPKEEVGATPGHPRVRIVPGHRTLGDVPPPPQASGSASQAVATQANAPIASPVGGMQTLGAADTAAAGTTQEPIAPPAEGTQTAQTAGTQGGAPRPPQNDWGYNIGGKPPHDFIQIPAGVTLSPDAPINQVAYALQSNPYAVNVASMLYKLVNGRAGTGPSLASLAASGGVGSKQWGQLINDVSKMEGYLNAIAPGLNWHPSQKYLNAGAPGGGGGGPGAGGGGDGTGDGTLPGTNITDLSSFFPAALARVNALWGSGANDPKNQKFIADMVYEMAQQMQRQAMVQQGIDQYAGGISAFQTDPLRVSETAMMQDILAHPDNTPWNIVQANRVSDAQKAAEAGAAAYGASAARRFGDAGVGAMPGISSDLKRDTNNQISRIIGDLMVQKAQAQRDAQYRALSGADALRSSTSGADAQMLAELARMYLGSAPTGTNPLAGAGEAWVNTNTFNKAANQGAGGFDINDALSTLGGLVSGMSYNKGGTTAGGGTIGASGAGIGAILAAIGI